jgi:hypothetical protein
MATCNPTPDPCAFCGAPTERKGRTACGAAECQRQRQAAYYRAKYKQPLMPLAEIRALISYDPLSGLFKNVVDRPPRAKADAPAGTVDDLGYIAISLGGRVYAAHRLAWIMSTGHWPTGEIDHMNGIRTDNRLCNLRDVTKTENRRNLRRPQKDNTTGYLGVTRLKNRFLAQIKVDYARISLGVFDTPQEAHAAYVEAKRRLHPGCTL